MSAVPFDTLKYAEALKAAGYTDTQARAHAEALADVMRQGGQGFATKLDITRLEERVDGRFTLLQWMVGFLLALGVANLWLLIRLGQAA